MDHTFNADHTYLGGLMVHTMDLLRYHHTMEGELHVMFHSKWQGSNLGHAKLPKFIWYINLGKYPNYADM